MTEDKHLTGPRAAKLLAEILKWRLQDWTPTETISAIRYDQDIVQGSTSPDTLPFGLTATIDTTWSDGPTGTTTPEGIDKWMRFWNPWMSYWSGSESIYRQTPGAWFLQQLQENAAFTTIDSWDEDDQTAWDDFTQELRTLHRKIAHTTGHAPRNRGLCPTCKRGSMQQQPGRQGFDEVAVCNNPECSATIEADHIQEAQQLALRNITTTDSQGDTWIYGKQAIELYAGTLTWAHLRDWHKTGKLDRKGNRRAYAYPLTRINDLVLSVTGAPSAPKIKQEWPRRAVTPRGLTTRLT